MTIGVHESLLRAVVQIAHHAAARLVAGGEQPGPGRGEMVAAVTFAIAVSRSSAKLRHPLLGVHRRRFSPRQFRRDAPHSRPSTTIGPATLARTPSPGQLGERAGAPS